MFKLDSPFMNFLNKVCDIMILNFLVLFCSIPIFTIGASVTAGYYIAYKMVRNEESYITKGFFKAFKENFKQSTIIWLIMMVVGLLLYGDFKIILNESMEIGNWMKIAVITVTVVVGLGAVFIFPVQARFTNTVKNMIKNGFLMALSHLPSAFVCLISLVIPFVLLYFLPQIAPAILLLAVGLLIYFKAMLYLKIFKKYEERDEETAESKVSEDSSHAEDADSGIFAVSDSMEKETENK